ncbi:MAG TPA: FAD-dependent oxidoreductase, partial [Gaiellaceae bacterium]|nr:FAD-dependent oxidoreductase [Gaiellaceae bacterium]
MTEREARNGTLIVGGGYAGSILTRHVGEATIVSTENFMLFRPLLAEAASATLEPRHVVVPLRMMCPRAELLLGQLSALDAEQRVATIETGTETLAVHYEQAVLALGSYPRALPIPGLAEHGLGFKDL